MKVKKIVAVLTFVTWLFALFFYLVDGDIMNHQPTINIKETSDNILEDNENVDASTPYIDLKLEEIKKLASENTDLYGWITIDDTKSDFYLKKIFMIRINIFLFIL